MYPMMNLKINVGSTQIMAPVNKSLKAAPNPAAKAPSFYLNKVQQEMPYNPPYVYILRLPDLEA